MHLYSDFPEVNSLSCKLLMQSHPLYLLISHLFATTCRVGKQLGKTFSRCSDHLNVQSNIQTTSTSNDAGHSLLAVSKQMFSNFCPCWDIDCEQMGREREGGKEKQGQEERGGGSEWTEFTPLLMGFLQKVSHL